MHGTVPRSHKESCFAVSLYFHVVFGRNPVGLRFAAKVYNVIGVNTLQHTPRVEPVVAILYRCFAVSSSAAAGRLRKQMPTLCLNRLL